MDAEGGEESITSDSGLKGNTYPDVESNSDARRAQPPQRLDGIVDWTSAEYREKREDMLRIEWVNAQELWTEVYQSEVFFGFEQLWGFNERMKKAYNQDHGNLRPGKARKLCSEWKEIENDSHCGGGNQTIIDQT